MRGLSIGELKELPKNFQVKCCLRYIDDNFVFIEDYNNIFYQSIFTSLILNIRISDLPRKKNQKSAFFKMFKKSKLIVDFTQNSISLDLIYDGQAVHKLSTI